MNDSGQPHPDPREEPAMPIDRDAVFELAELYAVCALSDDERAAFDARVSAGDPLYIEAFASVQPLMEQLFASFPSIEPDASLRGALEARLAAASTDDREVGPSADADTREQEERADAEPGEGVKVFRHDRIRWRPTGLPGVKGYTLYADRKANRRTLLLKMDPGSYIPDHDHAGIEEVMVLEGDLSIGPERLGPRDYFRAQPGARHGDPRTQHGCIALVFSTYSSITTKTKVGFAIQVLKDLIRGGKRAG